MAHVGAGTFVQVELVFHVFARLAEFERNLIRERTVAGLKAARARVEKAAVPPNSPLKRSRPSGHCSKLPTSLLLR
jgi:DNA invertase Pin-like site-specific DNA recombinase